jgi:hypothetical protein
MTRRTKKFAEVLAKATTVLGSRQEAGQRLDRPAIGLDDPRWQFAFVALKKSLRSKRATGYRVGTITEDDKYGDGA